MQINVHDGHTVPLHPECHVKATKNCLGLKLPLNYSLQGDKGPWKQGCI